MKKILVFAAAAALAVSCNKLKENEYELTGSIDPSFNGKKVVMEQQGGMMGMTPVDTAVVEDGKFVFKGTATEPGLRLLIVEGKEMEGRVYFILEEGEIEVNVDKDTLNNSVQGGTYNNEMFHKFLTEMKEIQKKSMKFQKDNIQAMMKAQQTQDTVTINKLRKQYEVIMKENQDKTVEFIKENPKAYINVLLLQQVMGSGKMEVAELRKLYNGIDKDVRNTTEGKKIEENLAKMEEQEKNQAKVAEGNMAPDFTAQTPDGKNLSLKEAMGKVTIIDFWASWCGPCRKENPNVVAMYNELHPKGLNIIGVSLDDNADKWKEAIAADRLTWSHVSNLKKWEDPIAKQYGINSIPATFILDATGKIVAKDLRGAELKAKVEELLAK